MIVVVLDTNILLRLANPAAPEHPLCMAAVTRLSADGVVLAVVPQCLVEFWVVATRPVDVNGLGWPSSLAHSAVEAFTTQLRVLPETPSAFSRWRTLVADLDIRGKRAHDARIAALMLSHDVVELLTLNTSDFTPIPGLSVRHPSAVVT